MLQHVHQGIAVLQVHADAHQRRLLLDAGNRARQQGHGRRHDDAHFHLARQARLQGDDVVMRQGQARQGHARVAYHRLAVDGRLHAARQPVEQAHVEHLFQVLDLLGRGRLRHVQFFRRAVDVALLVKGDQQQQLPRLQAGSQEPVGVEGIHE